MVRIGIAVAGDRWCNRDQVIDAIASASGANGLIFEVNTEGPSLYALGVIDTILQEIGKIGLSASDVCIDKWHNTVEEIPFRRAYLPRLSHFFWMSDSYRHTQRRYSVCGKLFGLFVGRATVARAVIMHDLYQDPNLGNHVLFSLMHNHDAKWHLSGDTSAWIAPGHDVDSIRNWFSSPPVLSITDHRVQDQYVANINTNAALVAHYDRFQIELVCETYCEGNTFFPTEKTVRPISQAKPMIVFGPKLFLQRLRDLGFRTWHDCWDESYDDLEGLERYHAIKTLMRHIVGHQSWQRGELPKIAEHNRAVLEKLIARHRPG